MNNLAKELPWNQLEQAAYPNLTAGVTAGVTIGTNITEILKYIFPAAGILLMIYLIFGGIQYMTSTGDPKKIEVAKGTITNALIGFFIIFISYWIVQLVGIIFGVDIIKQVFTLSSSPMFTTGR